MNIYWLEQSEHDVPLNDEWLCENERAKLGSIRFPKRRTDWRLGRWTAKLAVAEFLDAPASSKMLSRIEIGVAPTGAPRVLLGNSSSHIAISLSHSGGIAACAVSDADLRFGCDLETVAPRSESFVEDYFTQEEQWFIHEAEFSQRPMLVNLIWSAKESALKALEEGLRLDTRFIDVTIDHFAPGSYDTWNPLVARAQGAKLFDGWYRCSDRFVRTLVGTPRPDPPITVAGLNTAQLQI